MTPTIRLLVLWLLPVAAGLLAGFVPAAGEVWLPIAAVVCGAAVADGLSCLRSPALRVERAVHHSLPVSAWSSVRLKLASSHGRTLQIQLRDRWHPDFSVEGGCAGFRLPPDRTVSMAFRVLPTRRGEYQVDGVDALVDSVFGLWRRQWFFPCPETVRVLPNFREIGRFTLLATHHRLSQMGIRKLIRRGEGKEFHQLRDYRIGDTLQQIDWKATSRFRRAISKEYQDERDQQIVFVLDCGRRMRHVVGERSQFDHALNAILLLAHVAARQGDGVGLFTFGGTSIWRPPHRQADAMRALLLTMFDLEATSDAADYLKATGDLLARQHRRALLVIVTNSRSEEHEDLKTMVRQCRRKHLVVVADLREQELDACLALPVDGVTQALQHQALRQYLSGRRAAVRQLQHLGCRAVDVTADRLPSALVNTYLEIKSSGAL